MSGERWPGRPGGVFRGAGESSLLYDGTVRPAGKAEFWMELK